MDLFDKYKTKEITAIANEEDNQKCFQCSSSPANWICVYNGIFLCASCAGELRGFGIRIACIKSLILDKLTPFQVEIMKVGGNKNAKSFLLDKWKDYKAYEKIVIFSSKIMEYYRNYIYDTIVGNPIQEQLLPNEIMEMMEKSGRSTRPLLIEVPPKPVIVEKVSEEVPEEHEDDNAINENNVDERVAKENNELAESKDIEGEKEIEKIIEEENMPKDVIAKDESDNNVEEEIIKESPPKEENKKMKKLRISEGKTKEGKSDCAIQ